MFKNFVSNHQSAILGLVIGLFLGGPLYAAIDAANGSQMTAKVCVVVGVCSQTVIGVVLCATIGLILGSMVDAFCRLFDFPK